MYTTVYHAALLVLSQPPGFQLSRMLRLAALLDACTVNISLQAKLPYGGVERVERFFRYYGTVQPLKRPSVFSIS